MNKLIVPIVHSVKSREYTDLIMTAKERFLLVLDHREPDRVPIDVGSVGVTAIGTGPKNLYGVSSHLLEESSYTG